MNSWIYLATSFWASIRWLSCNVGEFVSDEAAAAVVARCVSDSVAAVFVAASSAGAFVEAVETRGELFFSVASAVEFVRDVTLTGVEFVTVAGGITADTN